MLANLEGLNLPTAEEKRTFQPLRVEDALQTAMQHPDARPIVSLFPDEPLDAAMRLLATQPSIQVVSRLRPDVVLGVLTLDDVHRAYGISASSDVHTQVATAPVTADAIPV